MSANQIIAGASPSVQALLEPLLSPVTVRSGEGLSMRGKLDGPVCFPTTALLSKIASAPEANSLEIDMIGRFEAVGVLEALSASAPDESVTGQITGVVLTASAKALRHAASENPELLRFLLGVAIATDRNRAGKIQCNTLHTTDERLACWFLRAQDRVGSDHLALTQDALGKALGVRRTTLNAAALDLKRSCLVRYARGGIEIVDREGLKTRSCRCYGAHEASRTPPKVAFAITGRRRDQLAGGPVAFNSEARVATAT